VSHEETAGIGTAGSKPAISGPEPAVPVDEPDPAARSWGWHLVRATGVLLAPLALFLFVDQWIIHDPEEQTALFLANRWDDPVWMLAEVTFLLLAGVHGLIGFRWWVHRHVERDVVRTAIEGAAYGLVGILLVYAGYVIVTF
jgi:succinate dehydrogenase hydrophobic anchor subunit